MKKATRNILSFFLAATSSVMFTIPVSALPGDVITIKDGPDHVSYEFVTGDYNIDGNVDSSDLTALTDKLLNVNSLMNGDINFDGKCNILDQIILKNSILNGTENLYTKKISLDVAGTITPEPAPDEDEAGTLIKSISDLGEFLDANCKNKKLREDIYSQYDTEFFKDNDLIALLYHQKQGNGIYTQIRDYGLWDLNVYDFEEDFPEEHIEDFPEKHITLCLGETDYPEDDALYPVTDTSILARISVPKGKCDNYPSYFVDLSRIMFSDGYRELYSYSSPDSRNTIYISQSSFLTASYITVYRKDSENTYTNLASLTADNGFIPFDNKGQWKTDESGETIFTDDKYYSFKWYDDHVDIYHLIRPNLCDSIYF